VSKARTAKIFPNAVNIATKSGKAYFFASLISRDTTHNLLSEVLGRCRQTQQDGLTPSTDILVDGGDPAAQVRFCFVWEKCDAFHK